MGTHPAEENLVAFRKPLIGAALAAVSAHALAQQPAPGAGAPDGRPVSAHALPAGTSLSPGQARREVKALLERMHRGEFNDGWRPMERITTYPLRGLKVRSDGLEFEFSSNMVTSAVWGTRETVTGRLDLRFRDLQPVTVSAEQPGTPSGAWYAGPTGTAGCTRKCGNFFWTDRADAERFARAMNVLIAAARAGSRDDFDEFRAVAANWRALERKPPLSEDAERHRVLAEQALQRNDLATAAAHYDDALDGFPGWPEGWMNAALLCEALKDYGCAADRIRHFLELMPGSREAPAAREKLLAWQELARR